MQRRTNPSKIYRSTTSPMTTSASGQHQCKVYTVPRDICKNMKWHELKKKTRNTLSTIGKQRKIYLLIKY